MQFLVVADGTNQKRTLLLIDWISLGDISIKEKKKIIFVYKEEEKRSKKEVAAKLAYASEPLDLPTRRRKMPIFKALKKWIPKNS